MRVIETFRIELFRNRLGPRKAIRCKFEFDDDEFPLEMIAERHIMNIDDIDELGKLCIQL